MEEQLVAATDAYLAKVLAVAEELGAGAMPDLTETQLDLLRKLAPMSDAGQER